MEETPTIQYWLFQAHSRSFRLKEALRAGVLGTFAIKAHKDKIRKGDKAIIWQAGKDAGCYALATITSEVQPLAATPQELPFFIAPPAFGPRVRLQVDYNLWNRPLTRDLLPDGPVFETFNAGLPGTNYVATEAQYGELEQLITQLDLVHEPDADYWPSGGQGHPLNLILYGPPGTGKTYQTVNHALSILEGRPLDEIALEGRQELRRRYSEFLRTGRLAFVTFHQSFSYEDFVEGIKPYTLNDQVLYHVEDGIFKIMCRDAQRCVLEAVYFHQLDEQPMLEFNKLYGAFLDYLKSEQFNYFEGENHKRIFLHRIHRYGDLSLRPATSYPVQAVQKKHLQLMYQQFSASEQIDNASKDLRPIIGDQDPSLYWAVFHALKSFELKYRMHGKTEPQEQEEGQKEERAAPVPEAPELPIELPLVPDHILSKCNKYVLIIDEINRGNIPAIFGELITLLEEDKRDGRHEAVTVVLPYSKELFSVPPNLYIIGTMNTADRSAESLDIALRRRFAFTALEPKPELIAQLSDGPMAAGVDLKALLRALNERIELLLGRDYRIGHAYFLNVRTLDGLKETFQRHILPLLEEYFFNDYGKIGLVLGTAFLQEKHRGRNIDIFADFDHPFAGEFAERRAYELRSMEDLTEADFIRIYDKGYQ